MAATAGTTILTFGREAKSLGTLRVKSKPFASSSGGVLLLCKANLPSTSANGRSQTSLKVAVGEKQLKPLDRIETEHHNVADGFALGKDKSIFSQNFTIRSYDMGPNRTATIETLLNLLQETLLNHFGNMGVLTDGFGATPEMCARNLIWVMTKMHVVVDRYPYWRDDVRVENRFVPSGKNDQGTDWIICDQRTGETLTRANSMLVLMNKKTRKLSQMPEAVRRELEPHYIDCLPILDDESSRLPKQLDYTKMEHARAGLTPRWTDLDVNQHVNNVKYAGLMLESVPTSFMESHELSAITLEYRRECGMDDVLQSLTSVCDGTINGSIGSGGAADECLHLLRRESGTVVARGRTKWREAKT